MPDPTPPRTSSSSRELRPDTVLLGTVALEPNRWGLLSPGREPRLSTADWLTRAEQAGFDGIELWENHATLGGEDEVRRLVASPLPVSIWNSYASFDVDDDAERNAVAAWVERLGASAVKFNVGNDPGSTSAYSERLARFIEKLPADASAICECHAGSSAEEPQVAREILAAAGRPDRVRALVHLGDDLDYLDAMFDALGERIHHVHVNFLKSGTPPLADIADDVRSRVAHIRARGFVGSYTLEFVNGVGTDRDRPEEMIEAAVRDLVVLRDVLGGAA
jgi:sugar phosphate isomerase/epimerase